MSQLSGTDMQFREGTRMAYNLLSRSMHPDYFLLSSILCQRRLPMVGCNAVLIKRWRVCCRQSHRTPDLQRLGLQLLVAATPLLQAAT